MLFRKLALTGLVAASIATAPVATPEAKAAGPEDIFAGALILGTIGALIANDREKKRARQNTPVYVDPVTQPRTHRHGHRTHTHVYSHQHDHTKKRHAKRNLPRTCLRQRWTNDGWVKFYSKKCLRRHGYR
ncbi:MAG: hypothetical protein AAF393_16115 [Pseudomonadota bacterium]